jgi:hypothetical protein
VVSLPADVDEGCGGEDACLTKSLSLRERSANVEGAIARDTGVVGAALASSPGGVINCDSVCNLLNECL